MDKRTAKISISAAGGTAGRGSKTYKLPIPSAWANEMGITPDSRDVEMSFEDGEIVIRKKQTPETFIRRVHSQGHKLTELLFRDAEAVHTRILADATGHCLCIENFTDDPLKRAFGVNQVPTWDDYLAFLEERCIPRERAGLREYLETLGLDEYDPFEIIKITKGAMAEDNLWIEVLNDGN